MESNGMSESVITKVPERIPVTIKLPQRTSVSVKIPERTSVSIKLPERTTPVIKLPERTSTPVIKLPEKTTPVIKIAERTSAPIVKILEKTTTPVIRVTEKISIPVIKILEKTTTPVIRVTEKISTPVIKISDRVPVSIRIPDRIPVSIKIPERSTDKIQVKVQDRVLTTKSTPKASASKNLDVDKSELLRNYLTNYPQYLHYVDEIEKMKFKNGDFILGDYSTSKIDVTKEIANIIISNSEPIIEFLESLEDPEDVIWKQKSMELGEEKVISEINLQRRVKKGITGVMKCRFCGHGEVIIETFQKSAGDEGMAVEAECVKCGRTNR